MKKAKDNGQLTDRRMDGNLSPVNKIPAGIHSFDQERIQAQNRMHANCDEVKRGGPPNWNEQTFRDHHVLEEGRRRHYSGASTFVQGQGVRKD